MNQPQHIALIIPTCNAGPRWVKVIASIKQQQLVEHGIEMRVIVVDSSSTDMTPKLATEAGFELFTIEQSAFNHGGTRQWIVEMQQHIDFVVFLTQDALLATVDAIAKLIQPFNDPAVAAVTGRQLPHSDANTLARHHRYFNYPDISIINSEKDISEKGLKSIYCSNSFAAYRMSTFELVGGFPTNVILAEDMILAAKMLMAGYKVAYQADATVYHSHNYSPLQEFKRYFDTGVCHARERWLLTQFGSTVGEGKLFVISETKYLLMENPLLIPYSLLRSLLKLIGYRLGRVERFLPRALKLRMSMHREFWGK